MRALLPFLVLALFAAGCIQPQETEKPGSTFQGASSTSGPGQLTAEESRNESTSPCVTGISVSGTSLPGAFCAIRTITVKGVVTGVSSMDVSLATFGDGIKVRESKGDAWSLVATLTAHGATPDDALQALSNIDYRYAADAEHVEARAKTNDTQGNGYAVSLELSLPAQIVQDLSASAGSGGIDVENVRTGSLVLSTGSGDIGVTASVGDVILHAGSGSVKAMLSPERSGDIKLSTGSGSVSLQVPEDAQHGYDVTGSTGSGGLTIGLKDGESSGCAGSGTCHRATFKTTGFDAREIRTRLVASTGSGSLSIGPS